VASHVIDYQLFGDQFSTPEMRAVFDEHPMLQRWPDGEAALDRLLDPVAYTGLAGPFVGRRRARRPPAEQLSGRRGGRGLRLERQAGVGPAPKAALEDSDVLVAELL